MAFIVGNLMSTYVVKYFSETVLFIAFASFSFLITVFLMFLKDPRPEIIVIEDDCTDFMISPALLNKSSLL